MRMRDFFTCEIRPAIRWFLAVLLTLAVLGSMKRVLEETFPPKEENGVPYKPKVQWGVPYKPRVSKPLSKSESEAFYADFATWQARVIAARQAALESPKGRATAARRNLIAVLTA